MTAEAAEKVGRCWECGYSLRGLPTARCPECGRGFNPADETTMNMGVEVGAVRRWLMRPPGWPLHILTAAAVIMSLWACAVPMHPGAMADVLASLLWGFRIRFQDIFQLTRDLGLAEGRFLIATGIWLIVGILWTARRIARGITVKNLSKHKAATFAYWRRWLAIPLMLGATVLICLTNLPVIAGFYLSKSSLDQSVKEARAARVTTVNGDVPLAPRWRGIYPPCLQSYLPEARVFPGETWIVINDNAAFVYRDDDQPPATSLTENYGLRRTFTRRVKRLASHWYAVDSTR